MDGLVFHINCIIKDKLLLTLSSTRPTCKQLILVLFTIFSISIFPADADAEPKPSPIKLFNNPAFNDLEFGKITPIEDEEVEYILQTRIDNIVLGDEFGIRKNDKTYFDLQNLFDILDFPIDVNVNEKTAQGWFIREEYNFKLHYPIIASTSVLLELRDKKFKISKDLLLYRSDAIFMEVNTLFKLLAIEYQIKLNDLTLTLKPSEPIPIQEKLARKNRKSSTRKIDVARLPEKFIPYTAWSLPFVDAQSKYGTNSEGTKKISYSALGAGDLAYMTGTYYIQGDDIDNLRHFRVTMSKESFRSNLLGPLRATRFAVGDISPNTGGGIGNAGQEIGLSISNRPYGRKTQFQNTDFAGDAQPGWDVELYRNNIFLAGQTIDESGRYEFNNQVILSGKNIFKLVFYGPQGQRREKSEEIFLARNSAQNNKAFYDISITNQRSRLFDLRNNKVNDDNDSRRLNLNLFKNINEYISFNTTFSRYNFTDGSTHNFIKPGIRLFVLDTLFFASLTKDIRAGSSINFSLSRSFGTQSLLYSNATTTDNFSTESGVTTAANSVNSLVFSGPLFRSRYLKLGYSMDATRSAVKNTSVTDNYGLDFSARLWKISATNNLNYSRAKQEDSTSSRSLEGGSSLNTSLFGIGFRGGISYAFEPVRTVKVKHVTQLSASLSWSFTSNIRSQYTYFYSPLSGRKTQSLSLNWRTKLLTITSDFTHNNNDTYAANLGINFSFGYDKRTSIVKVGAQRISRTGGISARIFRDDNNNGKRERGEDWIDGATIQAIQSRRKGKTNEQGEVFFPGLSVDKSTDIELDVGSLEDPFLVPTKPGYSIIPRPGLIETIDIPLAQSGEIEGIIYFGSKKTNHTYEAGYIPIVLEDIKTRKKYDTISAYDGFYLFTQIPPGQYLVSVENKYLSRFKYVASKPSPILVNILGDGSVVMGVDFTLYPI